MKRSALNASITAKRTVVRRDVIALTGLSDLEINQTEFEFGLEYAAIILERHDEAQSRLAGTKDYWDWWRNQSALIDAEWVNRVIDRHFHLDEYDLNVGKTPKGVWTDLTEEVFRMDWRVHRRPDALLNRNIHPPKHCLKAIKI